MIGIAGAAELVEEARWIAPPEVQAELEFEISLLTAAPAKGVLSDLEMCFDQYKLEGRRNYEVEQIVNGRFKKRFDGMHLWFKADCPDDGHCRFYMRVAHRQQDLHSTPEAKTRHMLNFMKTHDEWHKPPEPK